MSSEKPNKKLPIFNNEYEIVKKLGEGHTSNVYLARSIANPKEQVAIKIISEPFLQKNLKCVEKEI